VNDSWLVHPLLYMGGDLEKGKALYASSQLVYCRLYRDSLFHFQMSLENCDDAWISCTVIFVLELRPMSATKRQFCQFSGVKDCHGEGPKRSVSEARMNGWQEKQCTNRIAVYSEYM
jgi:hypothetical protein